jgi:hypothetical protein
VFYGEFGVGPFAVVIWGGIYSGLSTGSQVGVVEVLGEVGVFPNLPAGIFMGIQPVPTSHWGPVHTEVGVGFGMEYGIAGKEGFEGDAFSIEQVYQFGPIIVVTSASGGGAWLVSTSISLGQGVLFGSKHTTWAWDINW